MQHKQRLTSLGNLAKISENRFLFYILNKKRLPHSFKTIKNIGENNQINETKIPVEEGLTGWSPSS